ncbi:polysaccharide deacetylase family protein [Actinokineospora spheciospongiae]|uniref:polysaccharide deacetylase family protein n=1 Tax=Actinokineospora spheciospongiae TaxID=909613 RepID=UPI001C63E09A|nr:polysaccharide deacetylase family protein [Actinokineospora spheciospongiae]
MSAMLGQTARRLILPLTSPVGSIRTVTTPTPQVVLTYDDGPVPEDTPGVLSALSDAGATATFFVLVARAERNPSLLGEIVDAGHEVALHGIDHVRLTTLSPGEVLRRTREGKERLEQMLGAPVRWFRPPYGAQQPATWAAIRRCGLESVVWNRTGYDWQDDPVGEVAERTLAGASAGDVILMHDGHAGLDVGVDDGPAPGFSREGLARAVLGGLAERGLAPVSLGEAVGTGKAVKGAWFRK